MNANIIVLGLLVISISLYFYLNKNNETNAIQQKQFEEAYEAAIDAEIAKKEVDRLNNEIIAKQEEVYEAAAKGNTAAELEARKRIKEAKVEVEIAKEIQELAEEDAEAASRNSSI